MSILKATTKAITLALIAIVLLAVPAKAKNDDYFNHNIPKQPPAAQAQEERPILGAMAMCSPRTSTVDWFERFDTTVHVMKVSDGDMAKLKRPFNREAERVQQWIDTASGVIQKYRLLALTIRRMKVPSAAPDVAEFRDRTADWFSDVAMVYEDMIRPRKAPKTQEELDGALGEIKQRGRCLMRAGDNWR